MNKKLKKRIWRVAIGGACFLGAVLISRVVPEASLILRLPFFLGAYLIIGGDVVKKAVTNIGKGRILDENFLMTLATLGAFVVGDFSEAVAVMLFYQVGECFQSYAVNKSRKSITELMDIRPDYANVMRGDTWERVDPEEVSVGEVILVRPGEKIPMDGIVRKGTSSLNTMALTGESLPRDVSEGEQVISGCVNQGGVLEVQVDKAFGESTVAKILELVENAGSKKAEAENFITKFARYYTPVVVICALLLAFIPPVITGQNLGEWVYRGLTFLVISCPCALVISIPLSFFGGLGGASKMGVLVKGSNYLEALAEAEVVVMDKTGTLTKGNFAVSKVVVSALGFKRLYGGGKFSPTDMSMEKKLIEIGAYGESYSSHPIAKSLMTAYSGSIDQSRLREVKEIAGHGIKAVFDQEDILVGNEKLMKQEGIQIEEEIRSCASREIGTMVHVAVKGIYLGYIAITDELKEDAAEAVRSLKKEGIKRIIMLTGDRKRVADHVAGELGITEVYSELLPGDKVDRVEELMGSMKSGGGSGKLIFVGDGINDAPVLARADIGIAMGGLGSDAAIEAADVVIMADEPGRIAGAMRLSRKTLGIVKQNIVFAIGIKVLVLALSAFGYASMWAAIFADVGVAVIAILNAMRALKGERSATG